MATYTYVDTIKLERNRSLKVYRNNNEFDFDIITRADEIGVGQFKNKEDLIANLEPYMYQSDMDALMRSRKFKTVLSQMGEN